MEEIDEYYDKQMEDIKKARKKWYLFTYYNHI